MVQLKIERFFTLTLNFFRFLLTTAAYLCVLALLVLVVAGYFNVDLEVAVRNFLRKVFSFVLATSKTARSKRYTVWLSQQIWRRALFCVIGWKITKSIVLLLLKFVSISFWRFLFLVKSQEFQFSDTAWWHQLFLSPVNMFYVSAALSINQFCS